MSDETIVPARPLSEYPELGFALRKAVALNGFFERDASTFGFSRRSNDPDDRTWFGTCPTGCGSTFFEATTTERGLSFSCPSRCSLDAILDGLDRGAASRQLAALAREQGEDWEVIESLANGYGLDSSLLGNTARRNDPPSD